MAFLSKKLKKIEICSLMPLHLSKNIPEYQKNLKFSNYREIEKNISFFSSINKIVEMAISIKIGSNFLVKLQNTTSFFLTAFFEFFSESTLSRICSFKSLWGADYLRWKKLKSSRCYIISYIPIIKKEMVLDI